MLFKINVLPIIRGHLSTLTDAAGRPLSSDYVFFFGYPIGCGLWLFIFAGTIDKDILAIMASGLSIFGGLLFNVLLLVCDVLAREQQHKIDPIKIELIRQLNWNVSYAILLALTTLIFLFLQLFTYPAVLINGILSAAAYSCLIQFILTLLMILKRVHTYVTGELMKEADAETGQT